MVSSVARAVGGGVPLGEIQQALSNASLQVQGQYPWPWLYKDALVAVNAPYSTGTVAITSGSTTITGTDTVWLTSWRYKTLRIGQIDYSIASVDSATSLTLAQAPVLDENDSAASYQILQTVYAMPADYAPGAEIGLYNMTNMYRARKIPLFTLTQTDITNRLLTSNVWTVYSDYGRDDTNNVYLIKISPPPSTTDQYKLIYRRNPASMALISSLSMLPEKYVEYLELIAEARVRRSRKLGGFREAEAQANVILKAMKREMQTQGVDNRPDDHGGWGGEVSFRDGLFTAVSGTGGS